MREVQQRVQRSGIVFIAAIATGFVINHNQQFVDVGVLSARIMGKLVQLAHRGKHRLQQQ